MQNFRFAGEKYRKRLVIPAVIISHTILLQVFTLIFSMKFLAIACMLCICLPEAGSTIGDTNKIQYHSTGSDSTMLSLVVLGTVQDAGSPQIGCTKECCKTLFLRPHRNRKVASLGIVDKITGNTFLLEATPDIATQLKILESVAGKKATAFPNAIFLTHAHIGHYSGLMYLGKEAANTQLIPVYCMPRMKTFLEENGPWSQLVSNKNIDLKVMANNTPVVLSNRLKIIPITVPHRDEFSETVGYRIIGPHQKILFIPDIDKWSKWGLNIVEEVAGVDYAFLDGTFYNAKEIDNRDISSIPHPFVIETMQIFAGLPMHEKNKIHFIHFNHTNPLLRKNSHESHFVKQKGFNIATIGQEIRL
jgi:pyrroloquinoline quinone biosynthesis protein B